MTPELKKHLKMLAVTMSSSMDAVALLNTSCQIVYANPAMKSLLGMRPRDLGKKKVFCDYITLSVCSESCQIEASILSGKILRFDESPGALKTRKLRLLIKITPIPDFSDESGKASPVGAIVSMRDTSGEILMQAKYHKVMHMLEEKDSELSSLRQSLRAVQRSYR